MTTLLFVAGFTILPITMILLYEKALKEGKMGASGTISKSNHQLDVDVLRKNIQINAVTYRNGVLVEGSNLLIDSQNVLSGTMNFTSEGVELQRYQDVEAHQCIYLSYSDISKIVLKLVRRVYAGGWMSINTFTHYDLFIYTDENVYEAECAAIYETQQILKQLVAKKTLLLDETGILQVFDSPESFYGEAADAKKYYSQRNYSGKHERAGIQKYCDDHYEEWVKQYHFETVRSGYPSLDG